MSEQRYGYFRGCSASARHKKNGSKSKKCSLPSDNLTQAQWKKRCGPTMIYRMDEPISYEEFKGYPKDIQKQYIEQLRDHHGASLTSIQKMLGISKGTAYNVITKDLGLVFRSGSQSAGGRRKWAEFIGGQDNNDNEGDASSSDETPDVETDGCSLSDATSGMQMRRFSLSFAGKIDVNAIANSLRSIIGSRANGCVEIIVDNLSVTQ